MSKTEVLIKKIKLTGISSLTKDELENVMIARSESSVPYRLQAAKLLIAYEEVPDQKKIFGSKTIYDILKPLIGNLNHERFYIIYLDRQNKILGEPLLHTIGGVEGVLVDVKLILRHALIAFDKPASSIVISHNHPSGNLNPSEADNKITEQVKNAAKLLSMNLLDHVIVTNNGYYSYADEGKL
jgi:DNA repair protein RadC